VDQLNSIVKGHKLLPLRLSRYHIKFLIYGGIFRKQKGAIPHLNRGRGVAKAPRRGTKVLIIESLRKNARAGIWRFMTARGFVCSRGDL